MFTKYFRVCLIKDHPKLNFLGVYAVHESDTKWRVTNKEYNWGWDHDKPKLVVSLDPAYVRLNFSSPIDSKYSHSIKIKEYFEEEELVTEVEVVEPPRPTNFIERIIQSFKLNSPMPTISTPKSGSKNNYYSFYRTDYRYSYRTIDLIVLARTLQEDHPEVFATFSKSIIYMFEGIMTLATNDYARKDFDYALREGENLLKEYYKFAVDAKEKSDASTQARVESSVSEYRTIIDELTKGMKRINDI
ncbi:hypothetical protein LIS04_188 [Listeria phage LIS04]|nr:hypothetical protein LIS04_188 [Listeria phage LIS04]